MKILRLAKMLLKLGGFIMVIIRIIQFATDEIEAFIKDNPNVFPQLNEKKDD